MQKARYFTCRDMLMLDSMAGSILLTGEKNLDSRILRINTVEVPDIVNWVGEREFLITTGYPFKDDTDKIADIIPRLVEKKVVGMAIKPKRFIGEIPDKLIETARKSDFILIELSEDAVFSSIVRESLEQILAKEMTIMTSVHNIAGAIVNSIASDNGESGIENALEIFSRQTMTYSFISAEDGVAFKPSGMDFPKELADVCGKDAEETVIRTADSFYSCIIRNLVSDNSRVKFISAVKGAEFSELAMKTSEQVIQVFALEYNRINSMKKIRNRYKRRFVTDWITDSFESPVDICVSAEPYGCKILPDAKYKAVIICGDFNGNVEEIGYNIRKFDRKHFSTFYNNHIVLVVDVTSGNENEIDEIYRSVCSLTEGREIHLCVSEEATVENVPKAYKEAAEICRISEKCGIKNPIITYGDLGAFAVFSLLPKHRVITEFKDKFTKPLKDYDREHGGELLKTLECYYSTGSSIKATADMLFTHYNTICYRLDRIKAVLNMNIDDEEIRFQIQVALKLDAIAE